MPARKDFSGRADGKHGITLAQKAGASRNIAGLGAGRAVREVNLACDAAGRWPVVSGGNTIATSRQTQGRIWHTSQAAQGLNATGNAFVGPNGVAAATAAGQDGCRDDDQGKCKFHG